MNMENIHLSVLYASILKSFIQNINDTFLFIIKPTGTVVLAYFSVR